VAGVDRVVALGWPITAGGAEGVVAFLETGNADTNAVLRGAKNKLPGYMVPHTLHRIAEFPLNTNGKVNRQALTKLLEK
jgi:hypothetical protein